MKGWGFVYPPIWLLISRVSLFFAPHSHLINVGGNLIADPAWRLAIKMPIIVADLAIGLLLYWGVPGSKRRKVLFASLWLLHPTAWFESGVFGQFDAVAAAFLLTCVILLMKGKDRLAFVFAGLAIMTKQHTAVGGCFDCHRLCPEYEFQASADQLCHYRGRNCRHFNTIYSHREPDTLRPFHFYCRFATRISGPAGFCF